MLVADECDHVAELLGLGGDPPAAVSLHVANCISCKTLAAAYADLDGLLLSESAPLAPLNFVGAVMAAVVALDPRAELRTARLQALIALAAALLLAVAATWGLPAEAESALWVPDHEAAFVQTQGLIESLSTQLQQGLDAGLAALPSPPMMLLWVVMPVLFAMNWILSRQRRIHGQTT